MQRNYSRYDCAKESTPLRSCQSGTLYFAMPRRVIGCTQIGHFSTRSKRDNFDVLVPKRSTTLHSCWYRALNYANSQNRKSICSCQTNNFTALVPKRGLRCSRAEGGHFAWQCQRGAIPCKKSTSLQSHQKRSPFIHFAEKSISPPSSRETPLCFARAQAEHFTSLVLKEGT